MNKPSISNVRAVASNARLGRLPSTAYLVEGAVYEGDLVVVEALDDDGYYAEIETMSGRSERLYKGDLFAAVAGNRQSSSYLYGSIPPQGFSPSEETPLHLLSNGGIVGLAGLTSARAVKPLSLRVHGRVFDELGVINTISRHVPNPAAKIPPLILVAASATDAGKTTFCARLIAELRRGAKMRVSSAKLAGTGCLEDVLAHRDAGTVRTLDFPDVGLPSTYTSSEHYRPAIRSLLHGLADGAPDVAVCELGGDLPWANIPTLLQMPELLDAAVGIVVIVGDALSALGARTLLDSWSVPIDVTWVTAWDRNPISLSSRIRQLLNDSTIDAGSQADLQEFSASMATRIRHA